MQVFESVFLDVDIVDVNGSFVDIIEARKQVCDGRLSASGFTYQCNGFSAFQIKIDVFQNPFVFVLKTHTFQADILLQAFEFLRTFRFVNVFIGIEDCIDPVAGSFCLIEVSYCCCDSLDWAQ
ncbi:hypothetical protein D3C86_1387650 [compost metagenome]